MRVNHCGNFTKFDSWEFRKWYKCLKFVITEYFTTWIYWDWYLYWRWSRANLSNMIPSRSVRKYLKRYDIKGGMQTVLKMDKTGIWFRVLNLNEICTERCEENQLICILNCPANDTTCLSQCIREETECINGELFIEASLF